MSEADNDWDHDWGQLEELFHATLELPPEARAAHVRESTASAALRRELLALLESHESLGEEFLEPRTETDLAALDESLQRVGNYHLRRALAKGGMGIVYEAEQERPRRLVALKLLRSGLGAGSAQRRFEFEAELLARLDHPAVAKIHEAGIHHQGQQRLPYFAMELVPEARDIARYASEYELSVRERIELFLPVADAIEHGHQRGVLHRDLKPGNVLVNEQGQPKVIDFGVARVLHRDPSDTLAGSPGEIVGTLAYMSPEQAGGDPLQIDVRTDVYGLGALAYRLIANRPPRQVGELSLTQALKAIQQEAPTPLGKLDSTWAGDLETVVQGALAREREERYPTVNAFAEDLRRVLRHEPIRRTPPGALRRMRLFVRRNPLPVALAGGVSVLLVTAAAVSTSFGLRARAAAMQERTASRRSETIASFLERILASAEPLSEVGREANISAVLEEARRLAADELGEDSEVEARVRGILGGAYFALGNYEEAGLQYERMGAIWDNVPPARPEIAAGLQLNYIQYLTELGRSDEAAEALREAERSLANSVPAGDPRRLAVEVARGHLLDSQSAYAQAAQVRQQVLPLLMTELGTEHPDVLEVRSDRAYALMRCGRFDEAEDEFRQVMETWSRRRGERDPRVFLARRNLGDALTALCRYEEAAEQLEVVMDVVAEIWGADHPNWLTTRNQLARIYSQLGRGGEARGMFAEVLEKGTRSPALRAMVVANVCHSVAILEVLEGRLPEAGAEIERAIEAWSEAHGSDSQWTWKARGFRGRVLSLQGEEQAAGVLRQAIEKCEELLGVGHDAASQLRQNLARHHASAGEWEAAEELTRAALAYREAQQGEVHPTTVRALAELAWILREKGATDEAMALAREALGRSELAWPRGRGPHLAWVRALSNRCLPAGEAPDLAEAYRELTAAFGSENPEARIVAGWLRD